MKHEKFCVNQFGTQYSCVCIATNSAFPFVWARIKTKNHAVSELLSELWENVSKGWFQWKISMLYVVNCMEAGWMNGVCVYTFDIKYTLKWHWSNPKNYEPLSVHCVSLNRVKEISLNLITIVNEICDFQNIKAYSDNIFQTEDSMKYLPPTPILHFIDVACFIWSFRSWIPYYQMKGERGAG